MTGPTHALTAAAAAVPAADLTHTPLLLIGPVAAAGALLPRLPCTTAEPWRSSLPPLASA